MVKITKCINNLFYSNYRLMAKVENEPAGILDDIAREMQMVPKYLELAASNGEYRFNESEIDVLTRTFRRRTSYGARPVPIIKYLLDIGKEKGNMLSANEIKDFFEATIHGYDKNGQDRIMRFMKALKEGQTSAKECSAGILTDNKSFYNNNPNVTSDFVSSANSLFTRGISQCERPESLARVAEITGNSNNVASAANSLAELYDLSNGNAALILDLKRSFNSDEIIQIVSKLKDSNFDYTTYVLPLSRRDYGCVTKASFSSQRNGILKKLELKGQIKLDRLPEYFDVMSTRMLKGNFEAGKKRK